MSREIPIANIYYLLCYAWDALEEKDALADAGALELPDLLNLFARVLANGTHRLLHRGLDRGYLPREEELAGVRGKLLATPTLRRNLLRKGRAMCAWDELEYDTLPNRILKTTLVRLAAGELEPRAHAAVRDVLRWLSPVSTMDLRATHFRRVQLHRNNRIYAFLLHVCEFVHEHWLPDAAGGPSRFRDFIRDGLPALFEKFVFNFYAHELPAGWTTSAPHIEWPMSEANDDARALVPRMMTDVCISGPGRAIILDTKFYATALTGNAYGSDNPTAETEQKLLVTADADLTGRRYATLRRACAALRGRISAEAARILRPAMDRALEALRVEHTRRREVAEPVMSSRDRNPVVIEALRAVESAESIATRLLWASDGTSDKPPLELASVLIGGANDLTPEDGQ